MDIHAAERDLYADVWRSIDQYGAFSPGEQYCPLFLDMAELPTDKSFSGQGLTVLDAGCGCGKGAQALVKAGFVVTMADVTDAGLPDGLVNLIPFRRVCLWDYLPTQIGYVREGKFDFVYCCDVMEHLPEAFTMLAVTRMLDVAKRGVFLSICLQPDAFGAFVGRPLHQTVQSFTWWKQHLGAVGTVLACRDLQTTGLYYVVPR